MLIDDFSQLVAQRYNSTNIIACPTVTFQVTEDCCLNCSYCYQINKSHKMMSTETGKKIIDQLFRLYEEDNKEIVINKDCKGLILDFIGGEPLMNIETIQNVTDYFVDCCVQKNHIWFNNFRISIATNGLLYFDEKVQRFLNKYHDFISLTVSIDGPQKLHDSCRKDYNGNGSFTRAIKAMRYHRDHYQNGDLSTIKITIAPENLPYLNEIFEFFLNEHASELNANPIFEHEWTIEEAQLYYKQLHQLADKLLEQDEHINTFLFREHDHCPLPEDQNLNYCGGTGHMLAYDPDGNAYPCLRYMPSSLGNERAPLIIGDYNSLYTKPEHKKILDTFKLITRRSQVTDECWNCPVATGCSWCSAYQYQKYGTCDHHCMNICWMHRAKGLANVYYWNNYYMKHNLSTRFPMYLPKNLACQIISVKEYDDLLQLTSLPWR